MNESKRHAITLHYQTVKKKNLPKNIMTMIEIFWTNYYYSNFKRPGSKNIIWNIDDLANSSFRISLGCGPSTWWWICNSERCRSIWSIRLGWRTIRIPTISSTPPHSFYNSPSSLHSYRIHLKCRHSQFNNPDPIFSFKTIESSSTLLIFGWSGCGSICFCSANFKSTECSRVWGWWDENDGYDLAWGYSKHVLFADIVFYELDLGSISISMESLWVSGIII